jgi:hypothetical protein
MIRTVKSFNPFALLVVLALAVFASMPFIQKAFAIDARMGIFSEAVSDPASLADGAGVSNDVTAEGAVLGDFCVASFSVDVVDLSVTCNITAAGVATVRHQNESGGAVDLAAYTVRVAVFKSSQF